MSLAKPYGVGIRNVGSYQVSGRPYITGSMLEGGANLENQILSGYQLKISLPKVTKSITLWNFSATQAGILNLTFAPTGAMTSFPANGCYRSIGQGETVTMSIKCKELYLHATGGPVQWKLYAALTNIPTGSMYTLTGSGISES